MWRAEAQFLTSESLFTIQIDSEDHDLFNEILKGQLTIRSAGLCTVVAVGVQPGGNSLF
jgi:hypothetical protein